MEIEKKLVIVQRVVKAIERTTVEEKGVVIETRDERKEIQRIEPELENVTIVERITLNEKIVRKIGVAGSIIQDLVAGVR